MIINTFFAQTDFTMHEQEATGPDPLDIDILRCLQEDGRMSLTVMAEKLEVSIGTVRTRLNKLIEDGTVSIIGRVDPDKVGFHCYAHIAVFVRPAMLKEKIAARISKLPEVSFLAMTSGDYDLEVDVMCRDNNHLVEFVNRISAIQGVQQTKTTLYFKVYKYAQPDLNLLQQKAGR
ncbi:MAG TPA: Lrp/AsnC family transcriptional regulator [Ferruginibacter sp.]|nr:Lrp/AsnC family transcriptional regulator [Ferruginibacter sp.]